MRELSFGDRVSIRLKNDHPGLIIHNVEPAGWASLAGLRQGDLLLMINGTDQSKVKAFEKKMEEMIKNKAKRIIFFVRRGIHTLFLELEPDWDKS